MKDVGGAVVDMYEHLPVPFGLVRYGVAPDHPEVKVCVASVLLAERIDADSELQNCQDRFEEIASSKNFNFIGNINVGYDIPLALLKPHYDAILFAYGASKDRELGILGEDLDGVYSARAFVAWYNGLPGSDTLNPRLEHGSTAVIIGQGNVALDVARILLSDPSHLKSTDIPEYALDALLRNRVKSVHVVGRRGPMQASFTIKEVREIINTPDVDFAKISRSLLPSDLSSLPRPRRRIAELLTKSGKSLEGESARKQCSFDFLLSPEQFSGSDSDPTKLSSVTLRRNTYDSVINLADPSARVSTMLAEEPLVMPAATAFRSIGYKAEPLPGMAELGIPFELRNGTIPNQSGRVVASEPGPHVVPGVYAAGWVKRGPTGVIASTMEDAFQTAGAVVQDVESGAPMLNEQSNGSTGLGWDGVVHEAIARGLRPTSWRDWRRIDEVERQRGRELGKQREKITNIDEMLQLLDR